MAIKEAQMISMKDYEGKIGPTLFFGGCNFKCGYCHNPDLVLKSLNDGYMLEDVVGFIEERKDFIDGITLCGGEPTLQKDLFDIASKFKDTGISVKLDTNGSNPDVLEKLIESNLLDYVAMDIKSSKEKYSKFTSIPDISERVSKSVRILMNNEIDYEFRTTVVPTIVGGVDINNISWWIKDARKYVLQQFNNKNRMIDPTFSLVEPYSKEKLEEFVGIAKPQVINTVLRF